MSRQNIFGADTQTEFFVQISSNSSVFLSISPTLILFMGCDNEAFKHTGLIEQKCRDQNNIEVTPK